MASMSQSPVSHVAPSVGLDFERAPLVLVGEDGKITRISTTAAELLGVSSDLIPEALATQLRSASAGQPVLYQVPNSDRLLTVTPYPLTDDGLLLTVQEMGQTSAPLRRRLHEHHLETLGRVASMFAPEIREPLASIVLNVELMQRTGEASPEVLTDLRAAAERARGAVEDLLSFAGLQDRRSYEVALIEILRRAWHDIAVRAAGHTIDIDIAEGAEVVCIHPRILEHVVAALFANAVEATAGETAKVRIEATPSGTSEWPMVQVRISDQGPGVDNEVRLDLFEPFVSTKPKQLGLGLTLAREIIRDLGGELLLEPMSTSTFTLFIPRCPPGD